MNEITIIAFLLGWIFGALLIAALSDSKEKQIDITQTEYINPVKYFIKDLNERFERSKSKYRAYDSWKTNSVVIKEGCHATYDDVVMTILYEAIEDDCVDYDPLIRLISEH